MKINRHPYHSLTINEKLGLPAKAQGKQREHVNIQKHRWESIKHHENERAPMEIHAK
jgi:hypothetical protein